MIDLRQSMYLGHLGPIPLYLHWTFPLLFIFVLHDVPRWSFYEILLTITVLLVSVLLHELGHAFAAMATRARQLSITMWAMGGLCSSLRDPFNDRKQLFILASGPAVSLALWLGSIFAMEQFAVGMQDAVFSFSERRFTLFGEILVTMAAVNQTLFFFNILPIYPLDGGQMTWHILRLLKVRNANQICLVVAIVGAIAYYLFKVYQTYHPATGAIDPHLTLAVLLAFLCYSSIRALR